jgi:hypothetical protein
MSLIIVYIPSVISRLRLIVVNKSKIYIDSDTTDDTPVNTNSDIPHILHILLKMKPTLAKIRE